MQDVNLKEPEWKEYFFWMKKDEREIVQVWYKKQVGVTRNQREFLAVVGRAISTIDYDYRISTIEPSMGERGEIIFQKGKEVCCKLNCFEWAKKAKSFAPEHESALANIYELFLWYAYRIAMGFWGIVQVCDNSSDIGNYLDSPNSAACVELSGSRLSGGFFDGAGNTYKVIRNPLGDWLWCGGTYYCLGKGFPVSNYYHCYNAYKELGLGSGVIVLKK